MDSFFERFPETDYTSDFFEKLFDLSQKHLSRATFLFSEDKVDEATETITRNIIPSKFLGFRTIVCEAIVRYLGIDNSIFVTPGITILSHSYLEYKNHTDGTYKLKINDSFMGVLNIDDLQSKYNIQTKKQNKIIVIKNIRDAIQRSIIHDSRNSFLSGFKTVSKKDNIRLQKDSNTFYKLPIYGLFTKNTRSNFVTKTSLIVKNPNIPTTIIIPLTSVPFDPYHNPIIAHAQYIYINRLQKSYTIIDSQFSPYKYINGMTVKDDIYHTIMRKELQSIDTLVEEIMGEKFEPYMYGVECPQAIVLDMNCIWWGMLIMYRFLQSDPETANYGSILLELKDAGRRDKTFLSRAMKSFKVFVLKTILIPMLENSSLIWHDLEVFIIENLPGLSPIIEAIKQRREAAAEAHKAARAAEDARVTEADAADAAAAEEEAAAEAYSAYRAEWHEQNAKIMTAKAAEARKVASELEELAGRATYRAAEAERVVLAERRKKMTETAVAAAAKADEVAKVVEEEDAQREKYAQQEKEKRQKLAYKWIDIDYAYRETALQMAAEITAKDLKNLLEENNFSEFEIERALAHHAELRKIATENVNPKGGRRKKLTSTTRSKKRTHSRYGKHTRKSHRR